MKMSRTSPLILALTLVLWLPCLGSDASAETMGLGPDARESVEEWANRLGLKVKGITLAVDHAAIDLGECSIILAHETGSRCSGLFMDGGGARACLTSLDCLPWADFQKAIASAGAVYPPWRAVEVMHARPVKEGAPEVPTTFAGALAAAEEALALLDPDRARRIFNALLDRDELTLEERLRFMPGLGRLGLGGEALSRLAAEQWLEGDAHLTHIVRFSLLMGPAAGVVVADTLLGESNACQAVPIGQSLATVGEHAIAAQLAGVLRRKDVKCFDAFRLEVSAAYRSGQRQTAVDAFYEARGRFPDDARLFELELTALRATGQWRAAKYALDQRLKEGRATPGDLMALMDVLTQPSLLKEAKIAWATRHDADAQDPIAAFFLGGFAHQAGEYTRSYALLKTAAKGTPGKTGRLHTLQALNAFSLGDPETAKQELRRAIELSSRDHHAHWAAAEVLRDMDLFAARRSLEIALALLPHRSRVSVTMKQQQEALAACDGSDSCSGPWRYKAGRAP